MSSYELEKELSDIEIQIRDSIVSGDNFQYQKLLRMKQENLDVQYFAETKKLRSELLALETDRTFNFSVRDDLLNEAQAAAVVVSDASQALLDAQGAYQSVSAKQYFNDGLIEQQKQDIRALQEKLESHINTKLGEKENE